MRSGTGRSLTWVAALLSLFLVFVLPVCWATAMTRAWVERGQGPSSNNTNEEREEHEQVEEGEVAEMGHRPPPTPPSIDITFAAPRRTYSAPALIASVAPKPHPSQFSVKRLQ